MKRYSQKFLEDNNIYDFSNDLAATPWAQKRNFYLYGSHAIMVFDKNLKGFFYSEQPDDYKEYTQLAGIQLAINFSGSGNTNLYITTIKKVDKFDEDHNFFGFNGVPRGTFFNADASLDGLLHIKLTFFYVKEGTEYPTITRYKYLDTNNILNTDARLLKIDQLQQKGTLYDYSDYQNSIGAKLNDINNEYYTASSMWHDAFYNLLYGKWKDIETELENLVAQSNSSDYADRVNLLKQKLPPIQQKAQTLENSLIKKQEEVDNA